MLTFSSRDTDYEEFSLLLLKSKQEEASNLWIGSHTIWYIFRHAGVYTAEEIALVFRDKLIRLQSLYIDQFKRLHHRLREKRRQYLHTMRRTFPTPGIAY